VELIFFFTFSDIPVVILCKHVCQGIRIDALILFSEFIRTVVVNAIMLNLFCVIKLLFCLTLIYCTKLGIPGKVVCVGVCVCVCVCVCVRARARACVCV
jgi:hypothetical protein